MTRQRIFERLLAISNHDFCPWANRYVTWLREPLGWFAVAALAAGMIGALVAPQGWLVCAVVLVVMVLGMVWPWLAMRGLEAQVSFDRRRCHELDEVTVVLEVTNRWPWPVWGLLVERGFFRSAGHDQEPAATALSRVSGWSNSRFEFTYRPPRRGMFPHEPPVLATGFPFGIWHAVRSISVAEQLTAWPRITSLRSLPMLSGNRLSALGSCVDRAGNDGDIMAARPYIRGDSLRRVHWVHTARRDTLIVCERQTAARRRILIVLDQNAFAGNEKALDWSLRVVASLCREFHSHACDVACELNGERRFVAPGIADLHRLFDRLAAFQPDVHCNRGVARTESDVVDRLTILVTSAERWQGLAGRHDRRLPRVDLRAVVLDERINGAAAVREKAWIALALRDEPARQLQQQWERQCHDDWTK
ncbi:MAG: hypothetical protein CMJ75_20590 [Planctomycetaceae bacterium]|nr:hypothetical protein [Planctomycetaceae bacterium]